MKDELIDYLKNLKVLYVEDDKGIRKRVVSTLRYYFNEVYESSDGESGYDIYLSKKPHIVITDLEMPNVNGIDLVQNIRDNDKKTIIIVLTAYSSEEYLLSLINLNINHFMLKPINSGKLFDSFSNIFEKELQSQIEIVKDTILDKNSHEIIIKNSIYKLRKRESEFLYLLYQNKTQVVDYQLIEDEIWSNKIMTSAALKTFIKELRQKLPIDLIENIAGVGYRLKRS